MATPQDLNQMKQKFFQNRRSEATQQANAMKQEGEDAINRRFAALNASGSGAAIAAGMKNREVAGDASRKLMADVDNQELQANISEAEGQRNRDYQSAEAEKSRTFQGGLADRDMGFKKDVFSSEQGNKLKEFDLAERQFALDKETTEFNKEMAKLDIVANDAAAKRSKAGVLGMGGVLGTGLGGEKGFLGTGLFSGGK